LLTLVTGAAGAGNTFATTLLPVDLAAGLLTAALAALPFVFDFPIVHRR
jgi:hypothetical protein